MSEFQVGDRVRLTTGTVVLTPSRYRVVVEYDDGTRAEYHTDYVELVERPRRKLRVGSVWEHSKFSWFVYLGGNTFSDYRAKFNVPRSELDIDARPEHWREVPVEELEREAEQ